MAKPKLQAPSTLADLDASLEALSKATIAQKAVAAVGAITVARSLLGQHEARLAALELRLQQQACAPAYP
jgi:hypothetical protein